MIITKEEKEIIPEDQVKFKGKYSSAVGRRKTSVAQVRIFKNGKGIIIVHDKKISDYFSGDLALLALQPVKQAGLARDLNISILVKGGGSKGQAEAVRHGLSRALIEMNEDLSPSFKAKSWLTRDARKKERKKPGLKKARRAPQWSKR